MNENDPLIDNPSNEKLETSLSEETKAKSATDVTAENVLSVLANIILICGIIATIVSCLVIFDSGFDMFELYLLPASILIGTLITWSTMKVFANISITLKEIKDKMK
jgi:hypothetical protein